ncbi:hypothetical protein [Aggregatilinea lenta]|uniref:hypothetical protein n=1 Tax=Aggregatilinea lenta TaxID=913108 RepID=UPI0013C2BF62|nr:hypothetical protein [Aggregatilinea lenta]
MTPKSTCVLYVRENGRARQIKTFSSRGSEKDLYITVAMAVLDFYAPEALVMAEGQLVARYYEEEDRWNIGL